jgi:hypothetical protein
MINIIQRNHPTGVPVPQYIATTEGWIFGQELAEEVAHLVGNIEKYRFDHRCIQWSWC